MKRERAEKFATVQLFARLVGTGLHLNPTAVEGLLDLYLLELSQDRYRPSILAAMREARVARKKQTEADRSLLDKVEQLTVTDEEAKVEAKPRLRKKNRRR